jgi:nitroreductase
MPGADHNRQNEQTWQFIAIQDKSVLKALRSVGNGRTSRGALGVHPHPDPEGKFQIMFDADNLAGVMQLAAWELGVGSVPASIYEPEKARQILGFLTEWHLRIALSFGYPLEEEKLSTAPKKGGRRALDEIVHWDRW